MQLGGGAVPMQLAGAGVELTSGLLAAAVASSFLSIASSSFPLASISSFKSCKIFVILSVELSSVVYELVAARLVLGFYVLAAAKDAASCLVAARLNIAFSALSLAISALCCSIFV